MNFSLRNMLIGVVVTLIALLVAGALTNLSGISKVQRNVTSMATNWVPSINYVNDLNTQVGELRIAEAAHIMSLTPETMARAESDMETVLSNLREAQATYEPLISSDEKRSNYEEFKQKLAEYMALHERLLALSRQNLNAEASELFRGEMRTVYDALTADLVKGIQLNNAGADDEYANATAQYDSVKLTAFTLLGVSLLIGVAATILILTRVITPIQRTTAAMAAVSGGNLDTEVPYVETRNEVGDMARTLLVFRDGLRENETMRAEAARQKELAEAERREAMLQLADDFERSVGGIVGLVSSAATELQAAAAQLSATAQEASAQSVAVSAAAEEAGTNVTSVAASTEELGASVGEIGRQVESSASLAAAAVREAEDAQSVVRDLDRTTASIGSVVDLIAGLASQTNLLALNATIEAARAGEAGRGFAVVASEVKELASQTANATTDITAKIAEIQGATTRAATAMRNIATTINSLNTTSATIAAAVEQQGAATQEIIQAVNQASAGTQEVTSNIAGVAQAAEQTGEAATQVQSASLELSQHAEQLNKDVDRFLATVRAA